MTLSLFCSAFSIQLTDPEMQSWLRSILTIISLFVHSRACSGVTGRWLLACPGGQQTSPAVRPPCPGSAGPEIQGTSDLSCLQWPEVDIEHLYLCRTKGFHPLCESINKLNSILPCNSIIKELDDGIWFTLDKSGFGLQSGNGAIKRNSILY